MRGILTVALIASVGGLVCLWLWPASSTSSARADLAAAKGAAVDAPSQLERITGSLDGSLEGRLPFTKEEPSEVPKHHKRSLEEHLLTVSPELLEPFRTVVERNGRSLDDEIVLADWADIRHEAAANFGTDAKRLGSLIDTFSWGLPDDGVIDIEYLNQEYTRYQPKEGGFREEHLRAAQEVVDRHHPGVRAAAEQLAYGIANAKRALWARGAYTVAPMYGLAVPDPGKHPLISSGGAACGWALSYSVYLEDFPDLERAHDLCRERRRSLNREIRSVLE